MGGAAKRVVASAECQSGRQGPEEGAKAAHVPLDQPTHKRGYSYTRECGTYIVRASAATPNPGIVALCQPRGPAHLAPKLQTAAHSMNTATKLEGIPHVVPHGYCTA